MQKTISGPISGTVTFSAPVTVGSIPVAMAFDLDLANSVAMNSSGTMTMTPVFHVSSGAQGSGNAADPMNGGVQQMMGIVAGTTSSSFGLTSMQAAQSFTFATNSSTVFSGTSMGSMANGMPVLVDAAMQSNGTLMATRVQSMMSGTAAAASGILTSVSGQPATGMTMVMQNGVGTGMMSSAFASGMMMTVATNTTYSMDTDGVTMSGLPFTPTFDGTHVFAGQCVAPVSTSGMMTSGMGGGMMGGSAMAGTMSATQIVLQEQGLTGTISSAISSGVGTSVTLTLPSGSAFTSLTGATSVTVFVQPQTTMVGASSMASGSSVHVFGLLFYDGGQWKMVASRIGMN